jgi:hypothetical protein
MRWKKLKVSILGDRIPGGGNPTKQNGDHNPSADNPSPIRSDEASGKLFVEFVDVHSAVLSP